MVRPIDADVLHAHFLEEATLMDDSIAKMITTAVAIDVLHAPTVDAIPVSFIFDKMSSINAEYINIQRLIDAEPETAGKRIGIATNLLCEYNTLQNLIREWKGNENGKID